MKKTNLIAMLLLFSIINSINIYPGETDEKIYYNPNPAYQSTYQTEEVEIAPRARAAAADPRYVYVEEERENVPVLGAAVETAKTPGRIVGGFFGR